MGKLALKWTEEELRDKKMTALKETLLKAKGDWALEEALRWAISGKKYLKPSRTVRRYGDFVFVTGDSGGLGRPAQVVKTSRNNWDLDSEEVVVSYPRTTHNEKEKVREKVLRTRLNS